VDIYREEKHFLLGTLSSGAVFGIMSLMERKPIGNGGSRNISDGQLDLSK
jgi:hypothetical protein